MTGLRWLRVILSSAALLLAATVPAAVQAQGPSADGQTKTPIKHVITLMQENHSFDNYFGTYPGAEGVPAETCMPIDPLAGPGSKCVRPFHIGNAPITDLDHSAATAALQFNEGKMDGFVSALSMKGQDGSLAM